MKIEIGPYQEWDAENQEYDIPERKIQVEIHDYDTWNCDVTFCAIIEPMMIAYKKQNEECGGGSGFIDPADCPAELGIPEGEVANNAQGQIDANWFERHKWVVNEIIFAANAINTDWESRHLGKGYCTPEYDAEQKRIQKGFELFGKYLTLFWT